MIYGWFFFFNDTATTEIYTLSLHDALPIFLDIWQDQAEELIVENGEAVGVRTMWGVEFRAKSVVVTAGTILNGFMHIRRKMGEGGGCFLPAAHQISARIAPHRISGLRMKKGTPRRIDKSSGHFLLMGGEHRA